jgi:hypothetical protein
MPPTWTARNPHPGPPPEKPSEHEPTAGQPGSVDFEAWHNWWVATRRWNEYVIRRRRHAIACAVDKLACLRPESLNAAEVIALNVGCSVLDQTVAEKPIVPFDLWG